MVARRLQLQEQLNADIAECIQLATESNQVYVRSIMDHGCVSARGIHSSGKTDVTFITPELRADVEMRKEIESKVKVDWHNNKDIHNELAQFIEDTIYTYKARKNINISFDEIDLIIEEIIGIALIKY